MSEPPHEGMGSSLQASGGKSIVSEGITCAEALGLPRLPCLKHLTLHSFTSSTLTLADKSHTRDATSVLLSTCWAVHLGRCGVPEPRVKLSVHMSDPSVPQYVLDVMIYTSVSHLFHIPSTPSPFQVLMRGTHPAPHQRGT